MSVSNIFKKNQIKNANFVFEEDGDIYFEDIEDSDFDEELLGFEKKVKEFNEKKHSKLNKDFENNLNNSYNISDNEQNLSKEEHSLEEDKNALRESKNNFDIGNIYFKDYNDEKVVSEVSSIDEVTYSEESNKDMYTNKDFYELDISYQPDRENILKSIYEEGSSEKIDVDADVSMKKVKLKDIFETINKSNKF